MHDDRQMRRLIVAFAALAGCAPKPTHTAREVQVPAEPGPRVPDLDPGPTVIEPSFEDETEALDELDHDELDHDEWHAQARLVPLDAPQLALDRDVIRRIVRAHISEIRHCYNQGLARDPDLTGSVTVKFTIGPTGHVSASSVQSTDLPADVADCIADAPKRWKFPQPEGGGNVIVAYPFVLSPG
jgi:hypothetical protein